MRKRARIPTLGLVVPLLVLSVLALSAGAQADASEVTIDVAIDVDTTGNGDDVLGPTESCNETPLEVGETIDVDIVVRRIPAFNISGSGTGISSFGMNLIFDPAIVAVSKVHLWDGPTILRMHGGGGIESVAYNFLANAEAPGTNGDTRFELIPNTRQYASGDGVLTRVSLRAVGPGVSRLHVRDAFGDSPRITDAPYKGDPYAVNQSDAVIIIGTGNCSGPTPTVFPAPVLQLPEAGGAPSDDGDPRLLMMFGLVLMATVISGFAYARRRL